VHHFVTGTNANNVVPQYLKTGSYDAKPSVQTISNAMDVGAPSNFVRIQELHDNDISKLRENLSGFSYSDEETTEALHQLHNSFNYTADPHGAIGYLALKAYLQNETDVHGVFLETAHPIKFLPVMPKSIADNIPMPPQIEAILHKQKQSIKISNYEQLKSYLLS